MKSILYSLLAAVVMTLAVACDDTSSIGNSLADETVSIVVDSNFTVTGSTRLNNVVQSRTLSQLIGALDAKGYGSIRSDFVGQFMPSLQMDTVSIEPESLDSVKMFMYMEKGSFVGDSLVPMGIEVYQLTRDLPYPIYSDFNPEGYYDPQNKLASTVYTASVRNEPDSIAELSGIYTSMHLPVSLGHQLYNSYLENPADFANPETFAKKVFKGVYIRTSYGGGRITDFNPTSIRYYYHKEVWNEDSARYETKRYVGDYFAITPEVVVNNNIRYEIAPELKQMVADGASIIAAPAGYEVEMRLPVPEIISSYKKYSNRLSVINSLILTLPVEEIENDYEIAPPPYVLMVLKSKKDEFFSKNQLTDGLVSFYAEYDATNKRYAFSGLRAYLLDLLSKEEVKPEDYEFILTPVQVNLESQSSSGYYQQGSMVESSIVPYVSKPAMVKFLFDKAKIKLTFSAGNKNNL